MQPLIQMKNVVKTFHSGNKLSPALKGIDLEVAAGEFLAIIGKSGAGKTTLINMLTGVDSLTSGEVWVQGTAVHQLNENQLALWRGRNVGVVYQSFYLMPGLTLLQNVLLPMDLCDQYQRRSSTQRALDLLEQMELSEHVHKLPSGVSGGQQQRAAIARALANNPDIIVADEPTGRLDSNTAETIFQVFLSLSAQGKTIVMVTHDHNLAGRVSRVARISDGELTA
jgi:putative ABC transport system ATP-binding protein